MPFRVGVLIPLILWKVCIWFDGIVKGIEYLNLKRVDYYKHVTAVRFN